MHEHGPTRAADDETYWSGVRDQYDRPSDFINLENGYFGVQASRVFQAWQGIERQIHVENSFFLRTRKAALLTAAKQELARFAGCAPEELLITRNAIEALNIVIQGYPFAHGDSVVAASHDYDEVVGVLEMLRERKSIVLIKVSIPLDPASDDEIVAIYEQALRPDTRVLLLTHVVHRTGQIMPVQKIAAMARRHGVDVIVDGAHAFAQIEYQVPQLGADFVAVNLHKWLGAPLGVAMLYIRRERIADIAPFYGDVAHAADDIAKLGNVGTVPPGPILTIPHAIAFHESIGSDSKEARLRYLKEYWLARARQIAHVVSLTPRAPERACAIATFAIGGIAAADVVARLLSEYGIFTVIREVEDRQCVRVTPHLHTSIAELDQLVDAIAAIAAGGSS